MLVMDHFTITEEENHDSLTKILQKCLKNTMDQEGEQFWHSTRSEI